MEEWLPILVPRVATLEAAWSLGLQAPEALAAGLQQRVASVLPPWVEAGARGGYAAGHAAPGEAAASFGPPAAWYAGIAWPLETRAFDIRALHILRSALLHATVRAGLVEEDANELLEEGAIDAILRAQLAGASLLVRPASAAPEELVRLPGTQWPAEEGDDFDLVMYPPVTPQPPFALAVSERAPRLRRCVVGLEDVADAAVIGELARFIAPWAALLERGGFEQPVELPGLALCAFGGVQVFGRYSAEIVIDRFEADEGAWSVLVNLLASFTRVRRITSVEID